MYSYFNDGLYFTFFQNALSFSEITGRKGLNHRNSLKEFVDHVLQKKAFAFSNMTGYLKILFYTCINYILILVELFLNIFFEIFISHIYGTNENSSSNK